MKCKHCQKEITHYYGRLWHDSSLIFPQYCNTDPETGSRLHEPEVVKTKIFTEHVYPPIPVRSFDWSATFDSYEPGDVVGRGATEEEAVANLLLETDFQGEYEVHTHA